MDLSNTKLIGRLLPLAAAVSLLSCAVPPAAVQPPAREAAVTPYVPPPAAPAATATTNTTNAAPSRAAAAASAAATLDAYKRDAAQHIHSSNADYIFEGAPPALLKSVVVLAIAVDAGGEVKSVSVQRSNGHRDLEQRALQSVRRASPFPRPARTVMRGAAAGYYETWLFREDGRFQLRSVAMEQSRSSD
jgi:protein TonB